MTKRALVQTTLPALAVVLLWVGVVGAMRVSSSEADRHLAAENRRSALLGDLAKARDLSDRIPAVAARLTATGIAVPPTTDLAAFVRKIDAAGARAGVLVEQVAPLTVGSDVDGDAPTRLPVGTSAISISVGVSGSYETFMSFLDELATLDRLVIVDLIEIDADEEDPGRVLADLELRIFTTERLTSTDGGSAAFEESSEDVEGEIVGDAGGTAAEAALGGIGPGRR